MTYDGFCKRIRELHDSKTPFAAYVFNKHDPNVSYCVIKLGKTPVIRKRFQNGDRYKGTLSDNTTEACVVWYKPPTIKQLFESFANEGLMPDFYLEYETLPVEEHAGWEKMISELKGVELSDVEMVGQ